MTDTPIILASSSQARQTMLKNAGMIFDIKPANINEEKILYESEIKKVSDMALRLSEEKALFVSKHNKEKYIIGSDQILSLENEIFSKAKTKSEVKERLIDFSGKSHFLTSAVCVVRDEKVIWRYADQAELKMKSINEEFIDQYIEEAGDDVYNCVGCYALESIGVRLFQEIKGDYFTILGMPLLPLLNFLEKEGAL